MRVAVISVAVVLAAVVFGWSARAEDKPTSRPTTTSAPASKPASTQPSDRRVIVETSLGDITLELTPEKTPITAKNFLKYVDDKFYDHTIFHRVIKGFMIQGGGFTEELKEKETRSPIKNESEQASPNARGTIAMARRADRDSATAQFFINLVANNRLDFPNYGGYTVFGKVVAGMDVVDKIAAVAVYPGPLTGGEAAQPKDQVLIKSIRRAAKD